MHPCVHCSIIYNSQHIKASKCPLKNEWVKKMWYINTLEYYSAIKKNGIMPFATTWVNLESIILCEIRERQIQFDFTCMWNLKSKTNEQNKMKTHSWVRRTNKCLPEGTGRGVGGGGNDWNRWGKFNVQASNYKISHGKIMYSIGNTVNNIVVTLYGDRW